MPSILCGQVAVVTGASSGVGRALSLALAAEGAWLLINGRRADALQSLANEAKAVTERVEICPGDLTFDGDIQRIQETVQERFGRVDVLVHSAGVIELGPIESSSADLFDYQYRCNVRAPYVLTQSLLPLLKACQGQVVFINSTAGLEARAHVGQYAATKHALRAVTDSLREEVNSAGVRVLSVFLGRTATPMQEAIFRKEGRTYHPENLLQPEDVADVVVSVLRMPRSAEVTELRLRPALK